MVWALITGEYPPQPGGVADYSWLTAAALADAGEEVHVFAPTCGPDACPAPGVTVHRLRGGFGPRGLLELSRQLGRLRSARILVQYSPHAFGWKAMNLPFCLFLLSLPVERVWIMFHEVAFPISRFQPLRHNVLGFWTHLMAAVVVRAAGRHFVATTSWEPMLRRVGSKTPPVWLPVPSNVATVADPRAVEAVRSGVAGAGALVVGHFGTFGHLVTRVLQPTLVVLLERNRDVAILLVGRGATGFAAGFIERHPHLATRVKAADASSAASVADSLAACDVVLQPYADGITSRRGSVMAALALGLPIVTTTGPLTEPLWRESGCVALAESIGPGELARAVESLLEDPSGRADLGARAAAVYNDRFALGRTVGSLLAGEAREAADSARASATQPI